MWPILRERTAAARYSSLQVSAKKKITFAFVDVVAFFSKFFVLVVCKGFQEFN